MIPINNPPPFNPECSLSPNYPPPRYSDVVRPVQIHSVEPQSNGGCCCSIL